MSLLKPAGGASGVEDQEEAGDQGAPLIIMDGAEYFSTWSIGRGTVQRSGPGSMLRTS